MCGIAGIIGEGAAQPETLARMLAALAHRGPDGAGQLHLARARVGLTASRLALLDDDGGAQPWREADLALVFNGELYNHPALAEALTRAGCRPPRTRCDTETLARGWRALGSSLWGQLDGMFAAAIVDGDELILARDPHGQKPLFLWRSPQGDALLFASEIATLVADPRVPRALDPQVLVELGALGFPLGDDALLAGLRSLPAGHELRVRVGADGRLQSRLWDYRLGSASPRCVGAVELPHPLAGLAPRGDTPRRDTPRRDTPHRDPRAAVDALVARLPGIVADHARADHPVGIFLSGGLDSGLLAALLAEQAEGEVHSFTLADDPAHPDLLAARALAEAIGTHHHERIVDVDELVAAWPLTVAAQGLPTMPTLAELGGAWARR
ncbi:MAG: asparagine synthetase B, partial [Myxococcales bacterium]|nr:asparagine synthetase B [Myxococcales bacterium]